jgi:adenylate cyclase
MTRNPIPHGGEVPTIRSPQTFGELVPLGGGDPVPLLKPTLLVGRRESCDIILRFPNVSGAHCELSIVEGHWFVKDLGSSNGTKVNGHRVTEQRLESGDKVSFGRNVYEILYNPAVLGGEVAADKAPQRDIFATSLLSSAGLENLRKPREPRPRH